VTGKLPERSELDLFGERWTRAFSEGSGFDSCCTGDVTYEDPMARLPVEGIAALEAHVAKMHAAFPDARMEPTAPALERAGHACVPWKLTGTHRGDIAFLPATDKQLTLHGLHYMELSDGRARRARGFLDLYEAATQLGLLPQRGGMGEAALLMLRGFGLRA
jgi:steroid delta-isomerase-like uncharacterized protein